MDKRTTAEIQLIVDGMQELSKRTDIDDSDLIQRYLTLAECLMRAADRRRAYKQITKEICDA